MSVDSSTGSADQAIKPRFTSEDRKQPVLSQKPSSAQKQIKYDRFNDLYIQALKHKQNQLKVSELNLDEECTFVPNLYRSQRRFARHRSVPKLSQSFQNQVSRPELPNQNIADSAQNPAKNDQTTYYVS